MCSVQHKFQRDFEPDVSCTFYGDSNATFLKICYYKNTQWSASSGDNRWLSNRICTILT
jgi:hypothetical protein